MAITAGLVVLFSFYIVYDTDMIMNDLGYDAYIIGAVILYIDIINLFLKILSIMGNRNWVPQKDLNSQQKESNSKSKFLFSILVDSHSESDQTCWISKCWIYKVDSERF